ncbi:MAG: hypothetical protein OXQ29_07850 [Rhodospirillaceae bacterium]|nr:hypothetical protein [Rhodospirillaceae bacterium]
MRTVVLVVNACLVWAAFGAAPGEPMKFPGIDAFNFTAAEADALERQVVSNPQDVAARTRLLGYYTPRTAMDPAARRAHGEHLLWLIRNAPASDVHFSPLVQIPPFVDGTVYSTAKDAWLGHVERDRENVQVLANASHFLSLRDPDLAVDLLRKAHALDRDNFWWPFRLGLVHRTASLMTIQMDGFGGVPNFNQMFEKLGPNAVSQAALAFESFERAYRLAGPEIGGFMLVELAKSAFDGERYPQARSYAMTMLNTDPDHPEYARRLHVGNIVVGRVALREGDVQLAKYHLLEAANVPRSPAIAQTGPSMTLALALLRRGERDVVLEFLERIDPLWDSTVLDDWVAMIEAGRVPDFGANLVN